MQNSIASRSIFGQNLRELIRKSGTIASTSSDLGINRTQLHRYIRGESFPRPDVLLNICDHFGVDSSIYTEPLGSSSAGLLLASGQRIAMPLPDVLPDGLYIAWKASRRFEGFVLKHLFLVKRRNGVCHTRALKRPDELLAETESGRITVRNTKLINAHSGFAFNQGSRISIISGQTEGQILSLTTYQVGFNGNASIFLGYELGGSNSSFGRTHAHGPRVLMKIPQNARSVFKWARMPQLLSWSDAPIDVSSAFRMLATETGWPPTDIILGLK